jgi:Mg-chelatase subunit ChlD
MGNKEEKKDDKTPQTTSKQEKSPEEETETHAGDKLVQSVVENDKETIDNGKLIEEAINNSMNSFNPDMMFEQMVKDFKTAKQIYGEKILRQLSGYDEGYLEKNIKIPEFQRELKKKIDQKIDKLKKQKLLDKKDTITDKGIKLAKLTMLTEELDKIAPKGTRGEKFYKKLSIYGDKLDIKPYSKGDRYKDVSVNKTVKTALRRSHPKLIPEDIKVNRRMAKGEIYIVYALDASGSMKGDKISSCKKAGIALAYKAIEEKDKVGMIIFGKEVHKKIMPTRNFNELLNEIATIRASNETDLAVTIRESVRMFPTTDVTKHLVLITDAMPTAGDSPTKETIKAAEIAKAHDITISLVGIKLEKDGIKLAKNITQIGGGKLHVAKDLDNVDQIVLEDYYAVKEGY